MNVNLKVENDAELRAYVKDCIRGQVLSIVREEFVQMIRAELERKVKAQSVDNFNRMTVTAFKDAASDILYKEYGVGQWSTSSIKPFVDEMVKKALSNTNWSAIVNDLAKEKIKALVQ